LLIKIGFYAPNYLVESVMQKVKLGISKEEFITHVSKFLFADIIPITNWYLWLLHTSSLLLGFSKQWLK
jgi:hypothetical protein